MEKVPTGNAALDRFLEGGYEPDVVTTLYGPAGSGKTNLCMIAFSAMQDKRTIYIDTEGSFSVGRARQLMPDFKAGMDRLLIMNPVNFGEQKRVFERLAKLANEKIGMIILDSAAMLYRLEVGKTKDISGAGKELGQQLGFLAELARKRKIPVLVTNHIYVDQEDRSVHMIGGDVLKYSSKCLLELQNIENQPGVRRIIVRKHRSIPEGKEMLFRIVNEGIEEVETA